MHVPRKDIVFILCALLLGSTAAQAVEKGQTLSVALEELRASGLRLIFSSALVRPDLRVNVDPGTGTPEDIARRVLAPHGLTLDEVRPGVYSVVKSTERSTSGTAGEPDSRKSLSSRPQSSADEPLYQVDVYASRYVIDEHAPAAALAELEREDVETFPGLNQDVMRVTRFLPGTASNALSSRSHVRGGDDDELAVFFDGVPLFEPFHYKDVQSLLGLLDPGSISKIDFFSGVFPAALPGRFRVPERVV